jgi:hypothetical protein
MPCCFSFVFQPWLMKSRRIVARPDLEVRDRVFLVLLACAALPGFASTTASDPALASHQGTAYTLQDREVSVRFQSNDGHLSNVAMEDRRDSRSLSIPDAFTLVVGNGFELRASQMDLAGAPSIENLRAHPEAARYSDRLPGKQICAELNAPTPSTHVTWCAVLRDGSNYLRQQITIRAVHQPLALTKVYLVQLNDPGAHVSGAVKGSPIVDSTRFFGFEHPLSQSAVEGDKVEAWLSRVLPLQLGQGVTYSAVFGVAPPGQMRRAFLRYIERERAHPYRTFLHYNTWYDLAQGANYNQAEALNRVHAFGEELVQKRHVVLDSFLLDEGWDNTNSLWQFNSGFPDGFSRVRQAAAQYHFGIGVWMSPWGGYDQEKKERVAFGRKMGYEIVNGGYALSGPRYYRQFERVCLEMVDKYGVNQFKLDGTGNASQVVPGSAFDSDFDAAIHLIGRIRQQEPDVYINLTAGTYPSPFWLRYADSIWRGGEDHSFAGVGTWRQRWITYRDAQTYKHTVEAGPLFPLNSLMLHGIIYARMPEHLDTDPGHDFASEVHSYFGSGTQLQEMYITPSLLSSQDWDTLAKYARWSRANASILRDTHWIGGDPGALQIYGWAAWAPSGWIVTLRNPSDHPQEFQLDLNRALELPQDTPDFFTVEQPFDPTHQGSLHWQARRTISLSLQPFEVRTFESQTGPMNP